MSYDWQVSPEIVFISPELNLFRALWKGGERSGSKKLGIFSPPNIKGDVVQDMDVKSTEYPIQLFFDGFNHIDTAKKFFKSLTDEKGTWEITHPVYGVLNLQLVDYKQTNNPVEEAAYSSFDTKWLDPAKIDQLISSDELGALTLLSVLEAIADGINQIQQLRADLFAAIQGAINMINKIKNISESIMAELAATENIINDLWNQARNTLVSKTNEFQADASNVEIQSDLGNAIIDVIAIPLEVSTEYDLRIKYYEDMFTEMKKNTPTGNTPEDLNKALFYEIGIIGILISLSRIIVTSDFKTRSEVLSAMEKITTLYNDCITELDTIQENFCIMDIDKQYFSNSLNYTSIQNTFSLTMQYLLSQFFNLKTEKRFTLKTARHPLEITCTEYGDPEKYDLFIESNQLTGIEIIHLKAGREVVIYNNA